MSRKFAPKEKVELEPPKNDVYTASELSKYDGVQNPRIYVAVKGTIFDVTGKAQVYGPGGSYSIFAGKDGSKGLGKSSLKAEDANNDVDALTDDEKQVLDDWYSFFSQRYNIMGYLKM
ncbi:cytochrome b5-like heme/steroid binding domain-containing protein [Lipomyces oligophaga]|uniref:cytochrome b5-like heme/steroid binding domain-containing protein n=1 Tax=Lipomyces oligophaga TaxID=45792 RepID=UPI0034CE6399